MDSGRERSVWESTSAPFMSDRRCNGLEQRGCLRVERAALIPNSRYDVAPGREGGGRGEREEASREQTVRAR